MNELQSKYSAEIQQILAKYPPDRRASAVMPLLYLAQRQSGYIDRQSVQDIAEIIGLSTTDIDALIGFYTLYHDQPGGRYRLQVCTDLPCALRGAEDFLHNLCANLGIKVGETTPDGLFTIEEVTCLAGCQRAPVFQLQGDGEIAYHEDQTVDTALALVNELRLRAAEKEAGNG
ncbi:MAG: NAD(P)H-dependent oxidoreductase subunit E [Anaerolineaceae bacterium]